MQQPQDRGNHVLIDQLGPLVNDVRRICDAVCVCGKELVLADREREGT